VVWVTMTAVVFRRALLDRTGMFRIDVGTVADQEWHMRAALASDIVYIPEKLATWRQHVGQSSQKEKTPSPVEQTRSVGKCLKRVLEDPNSHIPSEWKEKSGWDQRISYVLRCQHLDGFGLYGDAIRRDPRRFLKNLFLAMIDDPHFFIKQVRRGFKWDPSLSPDLIQTTQELISLFAASWPPFSLRHERQTLQKDSNA